jgi:hypothetical protein
MDHYQKFRFSVTCQTQDDAVLHCLRGLCQWAEKHSPRQIAWGGTGEDVWKRSNATVTFHFSNPNYRQTFIQKADALLGTTWALVTTSDDDPQVRQRSTH